MNIFMNFVKRSSAGGGIKDGVGASRGVGTSLLPALDFAPASLSCSPKMLSKGLTQGLQRVIQDFGAIAKV